MAHSNEIYSGKVLKTGELVYSSSEHNAPGLAPDHIAGSEESVDAIIAKANLDADRIREEKLAAVDTEFERRIAEKIVATTREMRLGVDAAAADMAEILTSALSDIIGDTTSPTNVSKAIHAAIARYKNENIVKVRVSPRNFSELELIRLGATITGTLQGVEVVTDPTLEAGRCLIQLRDKQIEVSLAAQIEAFRKAVSRSAKVEVVKGVA